MVCCRCSCELSWDISSFESAVNKYREVLKNEDEQLKTSFDQSLCGREGVSLRLLLAYCFQDHRAVAFLQERGLLWSSMSCPKCSKPDMVPTGAFGGATVEEDQTCAWESEV
jgi:hypothetical protein